MKSAGDGPKGPLFRLRDAVCVLADAGVFESRRERADDSRHAGGSESGARELAERLLDVLSKCLAPEPLRLLREALAAELHAHIGRVYGREADPEAFHGRALDWPRLTNSELEGALRSLIEEGFLPAEDDVAP